PDGCATRGRMAGPPAAPGRAPDDPAQAPRRSQQREIAHRARAASEGEALSAPGCACCEASRSIARARARYCGPRRITAGPAPLFAAIAGRAASVVKIVRTADSDAFSTTATGVEGGFPAVIKAAAIASASPAPM